MSFCRLRSLLLTYSWALDFMLLRQEQQRIPRGQGHEKRFRGRVVPDEAGQKCADIPRVLGLSATSGRKNQDRRLVGELKLKGSGRDEIFRARKRRRWVIQRSRGFIAISTVGVSNNFLPADIWQPGEPATVFRRFEAEAHVAVGGWTATGKIWPNDKPRWDKLAAQLSRDRDIGALMRWEHLPFAHKIGSEAKARPRP